MTVLGCISEVVMCVHGFPELFERIGDCFQMSCFWCWYEFEAP